MGCSEENACYDNKFDIIFFVKNSNIVNFIFCSSNKLLYLYGNAVQAILLS